MSYLTTLMMGSIISGSVAVFTASLAVVYKLNLLYIRGNPPDKQSKRNGGELVAMVLKQHKVKHLFTLCGGHISPILVECERAGIRVVDTRQEATAVFAADATARLTGGVGAVAVTAGPGVTNTVTAVKNAQMAQSPVLVMGGAAASILKGRGALQDIPQVELFQTICKGCFTVKVVRDIIPVLRNAIQLSQSGTPGPVFVEFPIDVLYPYQQVFNEIGINSSGKKRGFLQRIINFYLCNYVDNLFSGAWLPRDCTSLPLDIPFISEDKLTRVAKLVSRSKKPLILVGSQSTLPPSRVEAVRAGLESLGIPCYLGGMARGLLGKRSPTFFRQRRRDALRDADLIILAGSVADFRLSYGRVLPRNAKIIAVNRDKTQLTLNSDMFWKPTVAAIADPGNFIVRLSELLKGMKVDADWLGSLRSRDDEKEQENLKKSLEKSDKFINPLSLLQRAESFLPRDLVLVADGGDFVGSAAYILRPRDPLTWLDPGPFGTLGVGGGFALGAGLARPGTRVWVVFGDGSLGYSLVEFDTFDRHGVPVVALVGNDACWSQIAREQVPMLGAATACNLSHSDYHLAVSAFNGVGLLLDDPDKVDDVLREADAAYREGKSVLINALIGKSDFRSGSISV